MTAVPTSGAPADARAGAPRRPRGAGRRLTPGRVLFFALFLGLPLLVYVVFVVSPFAQAIYYSFTDWRGVSSHQEFIGLGNYRALLEDRTFHLALRNNLVLMIVLPVVVISLGFALATLVTIGGSSRGEIRGIRGANIYRVISFFPYVIPSVVIGILFAFIYAPGGGLLNGLLGLVGIESQIAWLGDPRFAMAAVVLAVVWNMVGFYMVLFVAAIKAVPSEVIEAARLDGAGRLRLAVQVVLPIIKDNVSTAMTYMGIMALDMFVFINVMTPGGGTSKSTEVVARYLYETAFQKSDFGRASAMGVVLAVITLMMAILVQVVTRKKEDA
ncbi:carbohydrate ABC transporter permease [Brachybacterium phenoliresistens]|uniref:Sugar ABC transporter permease n=1 Tax=Brachybacterium phenoliresistens TaxID=396014 RepID=Z9JW39_9MICO|nr:sugar ABC transporter permease [Brachybacterium phenoliresistens]EWS82001.1 sugar ABC transporter permease [Brachybacterium phenoliresistens]